MLYQAHRRAAGHRGHLSGYAGSFGAEFHEAMAVSHGLMEVSITSACSLPCFDVQGTTGGHLTHSVLIPLPMGQAFPIHLLQPGYSRRATTPGLTSWEWLSLGGAASSRARWDLLGMLFGAYC